VENGCAIKDQYVWREIASREVTNEGGIVE